MTPVGVARQLGRSNPAKTLRLNAHLFDKARHAEETRTALAGEFGHLLDTGTLAGTAQAIEDSTSKGETPERPAAAAS